MAADFQTGSTYDWAVNESARNSRSRKEEQPTAQK